MILVTRRGGKGIILALFVVYSLLLVGSSLIPMDQAGQEGSMFSALKPNVQNVLHIPMMALFSFLLLSGFECFADFPRRGLLLGIALSIGFAVLLELIQVFVPGRYPSLMDMTLNIAGIGIGMAANSLVLQRRRFGRSNESK